ncbi:MAG: hypothetical protein LLG06_10180 [Desulfobacteraceae bacterium]|nr:hypothetical protein [Desulfobacteraceae bacterium]
MILRGYDAINTAKGLHLLLGKYSGESSRGFRLDVTVEEAGELAAMDQNLIFLDLNIERLSVDELVALSLALGGKPGQSFRQLRDRFAREGDDDRAAAYEAMMKRWTELKLRAN